MKKNNKKSLVQKDNFNLYLYDHMENKNQSSLTASVDFWWLLAAD